jgi:two-component system CheB/CheR fusion protein
MPDTMLPKAPPKAQPLRPLPARRTAAAADGAAFPVVALGASAGGLEACIKLLDALPAQTGMAFILVQHLDPTHRSLLVELLAEHTRLAVVQAADGMPVEPEHLYVIPPGAYLSVRAGALRLSPPEMRGGAPRGARLPFDVLLHALAEEYGARAACVVLSGSGTDGTAGLQAVNAAGGRVVVQDPAEADYDGMPRSAIATGLVDAVAPAAGILAALSANAAAHAAETPPGPAPDGPSSPGGMPSGEAPPGEALLESAPGAAASDPLSQVIALLRARTRHDFTPYKPGTLERRIERRMEMASLGRKGMGRYLNLLRRDAGELDLLAKDLLIHVTSFFRDPAAYACLAETVIPALLHGRPADQPLRIWVAGCSTGEEAYSIVMLFREAMAAQRGGAEDAAGAEVKLQVFASDVDADAMAVAREGLYPAAIAAEVSPERLARFFSKEDGHGYRVLPELRGAVVFTVQDLLSDPPFSRLDLVSCRNLMIYLGAEAQAKAATLFHFALKEGGFLLLGSAETVSEGDGRFRMAQKSARLYRHVGPKRPGDLSFAASVSGADGLRPARTGSVPASSRPAALAELCRQTVLDLHAPAAVLCDERHECLYLLGPTDRYLQVPPGQATADLVTMARGAVRTRLRAALG